MRSIIWCSSVVLVLTTISFGGESLANGGFEDGTNGGWTVWAQTWSSGPTWYHDPPGTTDVCGHNLAAPEGQYFGGISFLLGTTPANHGHVIYRQAIDVKNWDPNADRTNFELELWSQVAHSRQYSGYETRQDHILWWAPDGEMPKDTAFVRISGVVSDGDTIEIDTGGVNRVYEFDNDTVLRDPGNVPVNITGLTTVDQMKAALAAAINADVSAPCTASVGAKTVVLLWKTTNANGATNTNLNDANNRIEVFDFAYLPGTPQYETNQDKQYVEDIPMRSVILTHMKTTFFIRCSSDPDDPNIGITQDFNTWRKLKVAGSIPATPKVVVLEIRLKTDARLEQMHNLFDGVSFSAEAGTASAVGPFPNYIYNGDFETEPFNTRHHGCPGKGTPPAYCGVPPYTYDPPIGWGDQPPAPPEGYRNYLRDWGRDGDKRGPIEGYTNAGTEPPPLPHVTDPLGAVTSDGNHFWGRANPGGSTGTGLQGYWGHVVPIRNWSTRATGVRYKLRYRTLMSDLGGNAKQLFEVCWGDQAFPKTGVQPATRSVLEHPTDPLNFDLLQSAQLPWLKILDFSDLAISEQCATRGFVEIERAGEFNNAPMFDENGRPYFPRYLLLRNNTVASPDGAAAFKLFFDKVEFYAEAIPGCSEPPADFDQDGDVDQYDFSVLQACFTGVGGGVPHSADNPDCECADLDKDGTDIDQADVTVFEICASGPGIPANPNCDKQACCVPGLGCREVNPGECELIGGTPQGSGTTCDPDPCAPAS